MGMKTTKIYFDTEFTGLHQYTTLVSIGLVTECGKGFYAEFTDYDELQLDDWLKENVIDNLVLQDWTRDEFSGEPHQGLLACRGTTEEIKAMLTDWLNMFEHIELYSDCLAYDWVLFCQIWGGAMNIPKNIFYIPFDLSTSFEENNINPDVSRQEFTMSFDERFIWEEKFNKQHNAMFDALLIMRSYKRIESLKKLTLPTKSSIDLEFGKTKEKKKFVKVARFDNWYKTSLKIWDKEGSFYCCYKRDYLYQDDLHMNLSMFKYIKKQDFNLGDDIYGYAVVQDNIMEGGVEVTTPVFAIFFDDDDRRYGKFFLSKEERDTMFDEIMESLGVFK